MQPDADQASTASEARAPAQPAYDVRWARFSLLDLLLFFPAFAVGFSLAPLMSPPNVTWRAIVGTGLGTIFIVPFVLAGQLCRGRRCRLSLGEALPVGFLAIFGGLELADHLPDGLEDLLEGLGQTLLLTLWVVSIIVILAHLRSRRSPVVVCRWTDRLGAVSYCLLAFWWLVLAVLIITSYSD